MSLKLSDVPEAVETATLKFHVGLPMFKKISENMSKKSLRRVLTAVIEFPLHDETKSMLSSNEEVMMFQQAMELLENKMVLMSFANDEMLKRAALEEKQEAEAIPVVSEEVAK